MTKDEIGLLGRLTAYERLLEFLVARDFADRTADDASAVAQSIVDAPLGLALGLMEASNLQAVEEGARMMEAEILNRALAMAEHWRQARTKA
ncbi:hypothetical protein [Novosphingobium sp. B1]|uniref:hypothetical protein n=1 Tax=Novosphingobium sp. B1 TaxID=1938756 RepID=UPI0009D83FDC|nr:hypothetical protein [Novosphingobium sp. B1]SMC84312.1 hypothetical protein SAMN06272759_108178 [Novosphingobium sp. B1]